MRKRVVFGVLILLMAGCGSDQTASLPLLNGHAHNDYEHDRPLFDALDHRFKSIEADVYSAGDSLFVAHDFAQIRAGRTLRQLYLEPLRKEISKNKGSVYGNGEELILLIDIKDDGLKTYQLLHQILQDYKSNLSFFKDGAKTKGAVLVVVSGNRPFEFMKSQEVRYAAFDGRLENLESSIAPELMPVVSDNWTNYFDWDGTGPMPANERKMLYDLAEKARNNGYLLRFWATPAKTPEQRNAVWNELKAAGVGLIGADDLEAFYLFGNK
ncbi:phosphatidylinositol-specific phospholipase C/glycerophosphodiester phosphodiesterase family protein [Sunxiuqinia dokdonensis]|uniref:Altered inheritance of mitochondria protein 6 n=1 Tax=Sunxiuqinia dokdonensis TaxID=1409788 RepID=A0A0L8VEL3_9BACT|nr:phosphatidylinositol-specific phospholipase C/glycerophosphodiester phosphodiesterase family protein [Sunxiuqinia dokdonensis]KOH46612.1 hypothetical protein NC99_05890 [Sunxiuqinia dokdonensis]